MNNDLLLIDTNTIMYLIKGDETVLKLLDKNPISISFVTEIELLSWPGGTSELNAIIESVISDARYFDYSSRIKELTIFIKKKYRLKLADAIIAATAIEFNLPLVSADKGFSKVKELQLVNFIPTI